MRVEEGKGTQQECVIPYSLPSQIAISSRSDLCSMEIAYNSRKTPGCTWKMAILTYCEDKTEKRRVM